MEKKELIKKIEITKGKMVKSIILLKYLNNTYDKLLNDIKANSNSIYKNEIENEVLKRKINECMTKMIDEKEYLYGLIVEADLLNEELKNIKVLKK